MSLLVTQPTNSKEETQNQPRTYSVTTNKLIHKTTQFNYPLFLEDIVENFLLPSALVRVCSQLPWLWHRVSGGKLWLWPCGRPSRMGENSPEEWECVDVASMPPLCDGDPPVLLLFLAISAKEVTRGGGVGLGAALSLSRTGQLSMRSKDPRRGDGDLSRLRS